MDLFIDDGYQCKCGINALEGVHPELVFTYRPYTGNNAVEAWRKIAMGPTASNAKKAARAQSDASIRAKIAKEQHHDAVKVRLLAEMAERIAEWETDRPASAENLNKLPSQLFQKLKDVIFGDAPPDFLVGADGQRIEPEDADDDAGN